MKAAAVTVIRSLGRKVVPLGLALLTCSASCSRGTAQPPSPPGPCTSVEAELEVVWRHGHPQRAYLHVKEKGKKRVMFFDTGVGRTHAFHPLTGPQRPIPNANDVQIGCLDLSLESWRHRDEPDAHGLTSIGSIGVDFLKDHVTEIDLDKERLVRHGTPPPVDPKAWVRLPVEVVKGLIVTRAIVNGKPTRLLIDTGAWNLQLVDPGFDDSDGTIDVHDVYGRPLRFVLGESTLQLGDAPPRRVSDWRTHRFDAFTGHGLGPDVTGLLGLSSFGASRIVFDLPHNEVRYAK